MKARRRTHSPSRAATTPEPIEPYDLKFVPVNSGKHQAGGWYRELPDHQLEVMSRGQLERVALEDAADPEEKAKTVVKKIIRRQH